MFKWNFLTHTIAPIAGLESAKHFSFKWKNHQNSTPYQIFSKIINILINE